LLKLKTQLNFISLNVISKISMSQNFVKFQNLEAMFEPKITLKFMKLSEKAQAPKKGSIRAAGFDLFSAVDVEIGSNDQAMISTDLKVAVPRGTYGRVAPWSGIAVDYNVHKGAGVIYEDY
jgi:dUTP pyrophosphatase